MKTRRPFRHALAGVALLLAALVPAQSSSAAEGPPAVDGSDPVATALAWSSLRADGSSANAIIATTAGFADSLASGVLQGVLDAPLLLTPTDSLDPRVVTELDRLQVTDVYILGGTAAISQAVEDELGQQAARVFRVAGQTRIETAVEVANTAYPDSSPNTVIVARAIGDGTSAFADALAAGAAAARNGYPVLLTPTESLAQAVSDFLTANGVTQVFVVGGTAAVSTDVENAIRGMGISTERIAGASRFSTATSTTFRLGDPVAPITVVEGLGSSAWVSGFAAAGIATGGLVLSQESVATGTTMHALLAAADTRPDPIRCGPILDAAVCEQFVAAAEVPGDIPAPIIAILDSNQEVPPNSATGSGVVSISAGGAEGVCIQTTITGLTDDMIGSHIHEAPFGQNGPVAVPFTVSPIEGIQDAAIGCVPSVEMGALFRLFSDPSGFYVNIHTPGFPDGEIRGQAFAPDVLVGAGLTGDAEVPGPGDPSAEGSALVWDTNVADELCYTVDVGNLSPPPSAAHIHRGAEGANGPVVVALENVVANPMWSRCQRGLDPALVAEILSTPSSFYVNVHNESFPAGAIRGQLFEQSRD